MQRTLLCAALVFAPLQALNPLGVNPVRGRQPAAGSVGTKSAKDFGSSLIQDQKRDVTANDLWPNSPPPGQLDHEVHGFLKKVEDDCNPVTRIPNVIHRIMFFEKEDLSEMELKRCMDRRFLFFFRENTMLKAYDAWERKNRDDGFHYKCYNIKDAELYIEQHYQQTVLDAFQGLQPYAYKADLFRYLVLYNEGGWYVDLKLKPVSLSLQELLENLANETRMLPEQVSFVGTYQNFGWNVKGAEGIINSFLGAKPRHPVLGDTIARIVLDILSGHKGLTPWSLTGLFSHTPCMPPALFYQQPPWPCGSLRV